MAWDKNKQESGFTIVELLIVIVVIGILAAITIVAYSGIQQQSNNTSVISSASSYLKLIQSYIAVSGKYPDTSWACVSTTAGCSLAGTNATFNTNMATVGVPPKSVPVTGPDRFGLQYIYDSTRTFNGAPQPAMLLYWLSGLNQERKVSGVATPVFGAIVTSTTGYTDGNDASTGKTLCAITIPGPGA